MPSLPPSTDADAGLIKGAAIRQFVRWYASARGLGNRHQIFGTLPPDVRRHFNLDQQNLGIIDSNWYPASVLKAVIDRAFDDVPPEQRTEMARAVAREVMDSTVRGV